MEEVRAVSLWRITTRVEINKIYLIRYWINLPKLYLPTSDSARAQNLAGAPLIKGKLILPQEEKFFLVLIIYPSYIVAEERSTDAGTVFVIIV